MPALPKDRSQLKPLKFLDRRSSVKKAKDRLSRNNNNIIHPLNNDFNYDSEIEQSTGDNIPDDNIPPVEPLAIPTTEETVDEEITPLMPDEYTTILHYCWEICRQLKHESDISFMNELIGFKLLQDRTETCKPM
jgi:hypothetical protein